MNIGEGNLYEWLKSKIEFHNYTTIEFILSASNKVGVGVGHLSRANSYASHFKNSPIQTQLILIQDSNKHPLYTLTNYFNEIIIQKSIEGFIQSNLHVKPVTSQNIYVWDLPPNSDSTFERPPGYHIWVSDANTSPQGNTNLWIVPWPIELPKTSFDQLVGPKWMPLGELPKATKTQSKVSATFGGSDPLDLSYQLWSKWQSAEFAEIRLQNTLSIYLGPAYQGKLHQEKTSHGVEFNFSVEDLNSELVNSRFVLCCGGITPWALSKMNLNFAIIPSIEHEIDNAKRLEKYLGKHLILPQPQDPCFGGEFDLKLNNSNSVSDNIESRRSYDDI